jgi:hypothetical protein
LRRDERIRAKAIGEPSAHGPVKDIQRMLDDIDRAVNSAARINSPEGIPDTP